MSPPRRRRYYIVEIPRRTAFVRHVITVIGVCTTVGIHGRGMGQNHRRGLPDRNQIFEFRGLRPRGPATLDGDGGGVAKFFNRLS